MKVYKLTYRGSEPGRDGDVVTAHDGYGWELFAVQFVGLPFNFQGQEAEARVRNMLRCQGMHLCGHDNEIICLVAEHVRQRVVESIH